jgi:hypothetical protein
MRSFPKKTERILAGVLIDESINFTFEVWAYEKMTEAQIDSRFAAWNRKRDKRRSLRNKTVQAISNHGLLLR